MFKMKRRSNFDISKCARPNILALQPYRCARDDYKDDGTNILLDANENAYGPGLNLHKDGGLSANGSGASHTARRPVEVDLEGLNRYPDPHQKELKELWCNLRNMHHHTPRQLKPENVFLGVGSDEVIDAILRCFCTPGKEKILVCPPTYGMYAQSAQINELQIVEVPLDAKASFNLQPTAINDAISTDDLIKVVYICSPGNPTAKSIAKGDLQQILEHPTWNGVVVLDEAYIDLAPERSSLAEFVTEWPNLIVMQTLSKAFGLAGIRLGAAFTSPDIARLLNNLKAPYNISSPTSALARAALQRNNLEITRTNIQKIIKQRERMLRELPNIPGIGRRLGGTDSNFLLYEVLDKPREEGGKPCNETAMALNEVLDEPREEGGKPCNETAMALYERLAETKRIVVRFRGKEVGCLGCLRITVGTEKEVDRLIEQIKVVLGNIFNQATRKGDNLQEVKEIEANGVIA